MSEVTTENTDSTDRPEPIKDEQISIYAVVIQAGLTILLPIMWLNDFYLFNSQEILLQQQSTEMVEILRFVGTIGAVSGIIALTILTLTIFYTYFIADTANNKAFNLVIGHPDLSIVFAAPVSFFSVVVLGNFPTLLPF